MTRSAALAVLLLACPCVSQTTVGQTTLPLGPYAFARNVTCLGAHGCTDVLFSDGPPNYRYLPWKTGLMGGSNLLRVVVPDMEDDDEIQLDFAVPIANGPGPDVYLAQAKFIAGSLAMFDPVGVNAIDVRFDGSPSWHTVVSSQFRRDSIAGTRYVYYTDGGPIESGAYDLWFTTIDLQDYGLGPGAAITTLDIRGPRVASWPDTLGLDMVTVASLNGPWVDLAAGLAGSAGVPTLVGTGRTTVPNSVTLGLSNARPSAPAALAFGVSRLDQSFLGGVLVPYPDVAIPLTTDGTGAFTYTLPWPNIPGGTSFWLQCWVVDPAGPRGVAASNALRSTGL